MHRLLLRLALPTSWLGAAVAAVVELGRDNFDAALLEHHRLLVQFYAPWCGHCKSLAPEYEKAAEEFEGKVVFARVDATEEQELAEQYHVEGYPTIFFFRDARAEPYTGSRDAKGISLWLENALAPALKIVTREALEAAIKERKVAPYFVARGDERLKGIFSKSAEKRRMYGVFYFADVSPGFEPWVEIHRGIDEVVPLRGKGIYDETILEKFLTDELLPPFGEINDENFEGYLERESKGIVWACFRQEMYKEDARRHQASFKEAAEKFRQFLFVFTDTREYEEHVREELGCKEFPTLVLQLGNLTDPDSLRRFKRPFAEAELTGPSIIAWIQDISEGKIEESDILDELDDDDDFAEEEAEGVEGEQAAAGAAPKQHVEL